MDDREATQRFAIFNILTSHCGEFLTGDRVEQIRDEIFDEMTTGGCSWAFKPGRLTRHQARPLRQPRLTTAGETRIKKRRQSMNTNNGKRFDQIRLLEICQKYTDTGEWEGTFSYPDCGPDLVRQGLATENRQITIAGRAALWLVGKGEDPTDSQVC